MGIRYTPALDGLRAVAVLSVIAYHAGAPAGFVGVDVFFVISGYLITRLLMEDGRLVEFYARRARRILPAAFLCVVVTLALSFLLLPSAGDVARSAAAAGVFVANLFFQSATGDYWSADAASMPLLHLWSLSVEEQFYLAWPLVLIFARKRPTILWWVFGASLALYAALSYWNPNAAFYQTPARAWELAAGGLVATGQLSRIRDVRVGLPLILFACLFPLSVPLSVFLSVVGTAMVIAWVHAGGTIRILESRPTVWIGLMSYSLYLWHWPLLAIDRATRIGDTPLSTRLALCAVAFVLAALSYRYVETPFRRAQVPPRRAIVVGVAFAIALSTTAFALADTPTPKPAIVKPLACAPWGKGVRTELQPRHCALDAPKVMIWGDSHARAWAELALEIARQEGLAAVYFGAPACPPYVGEIVPLEEPSWTRGCVAHNRQTIAYLEANGVDTLILVARWSVRIRDYPTWPPEFLALVRQVSPKVRRIVIVGPTPEMRDAVPKCIALGTSCAISRSDFERTLPATRALMHELDAFPNVVVLTPADWLCDADTCPDVRDGVPMYSDAHHLTPEAVRGFIEASR